jgi:hypothetical protein
MTTVNQVVDLLQAELDARSTMLRSPEVVMRPEMLGAARLTRYSFSRTMLRRAVADGWTAGLVHQDLDAEGRELEKGAEAYGDQPAIYQAYEPLPADEAGRRYQAGGFFAYEGCGLGYRRGGEILGNMSKFVGHLVRV